MLVFKSRKNLYGLDFNNTKIKRNAKIKTLSSLYSNVKLGNSNINVNPMILFSRIVAIAQREEDVSMFFKYLV